MAKNEDANDRYNEETVLGDFQRVFEERLGLQLYATKDSDVADSDCLWVYDDDEPGLVQEVKCRFVAKDKYTTLKIDKAKIDANLDLAERRRVDFLLSIWWGAAVAGDDEAWGRFINRQQAAEFEVDENWGRDDRPNEHNGDRDVAYIIPIRTFLWSVRMGRKRRRSSNRR